MKVETSLFDLASRFVGQREIAGTADNPWVNAAHSLCGLGFDAGDETPWCSSFVNMCAWLLGLERSGSAAARSWLGVGVPVDTAQWQRGDVAILLRGDNPTQGHVGLVHEIRGETITLLGGNQSDSVSLCDYDMSRLLGLRRLRQF